MVSSPDALPDAEYTRLLEFRAGLRRFLSWSAQQAARAGLTPTQHQLLLAIRGHPGPAGPSISEVADYLCTRHHSAVQLIDRTERLGFVARSRSDGDDRRVVRLALTKAGKAKLAQLTATHLEELRQLAPSIDALVGPPDAAATGATS